MKLGHDMTYLLGVHLRGRRGRLGREHEREALVEAQAALSRRRKGPRNLPPWRPKGALGTVVMYLHTSLPPAIELDLP